MTPWSDQSSRADGASPCGSSSRLPPWTARMPYRGGCEAQGHWLRSFPSNIIIMEINTPQQKIENRAIVIEPISEREPLHFNCSCRMCVGFEPKQVMKMLEVQESNVRASLSGRKNSNFSQNFLQTVLRHLLLPSNKIVKRGIDIFIPQVCYFQQGQPVSFYFNRDIDDYHLIRLKKDKISIFNVLKMFNQRRKAYRERLRSALFLDFDEGKREISKLSWKRKANQPKAKSDHLNCVILRYVDGCETLLTESDFFQVMHKRRLDPAWKRIASIKNYYNPYHTNQDDKYLFTPTYDNKRIVEKELHDRAFQLMQTYNQREHPGSKKYISDADQAIFCEETKQRSPACFVTYMMYKIIAFIAIFADQEIVKAKFSFLLNETGKCYLLDVLDLTISPLLKYDWTNDKFVQMTNKREFQRYHKKELKLSPQTLDKSTMIESLMSNQYENLKKTFGVTAQLKEDENQRLNNEFFQAIHPQLNMDLSELVKIDMPFIDFKKKYLGEKEERKTLFRPFNSKFVRDLHKLTPINRYSLGHRAYQQRQAGWQKRKSSDLWKTVSH